MSLRIGYSGRMFRGTRLPWMVEGLFFGAGGNSVTHGI